MTTRRGFLAANLIGAAGLAANPARMFSESASLASPLAAPYATRSNRDFWNDWPAYLTAEMNRLRSTRLEELSAIRSATQMQERTTMIRSRLWELIGGQPQKTPLNPRVTGTLDRGQYRIENIIFESFPKVYVTANLYLPTQGKPPYPTILAPVGHSDNGKEYVAYQHTYQNLARKGYVVLTYDPFGQGERVQYFNPKTGRPLFFGDGAEGEHEQEGRPMVLMGETLALYYVWDGIRGLDYLVSRPEVDQTRLGCTGHSGGGTMTMYLAALEPRLSAAVVGDGNSENVAGPFFDPPGATDDAEQNIVGSLPLGIDRGDLLLAFAPKPLLICYTTHDEGVVYSPGYEESNKHIYKELQRVYELFGMKDHVGLYASHLPHSLNFFVRTQTYTWFNRWLNRPDAGIDDAPLDIIPGKELNATSTGQVLTSLGGRSVVQLNTDRARLALQKSPFQNHSIDGTILRRKAREELTELLALPKLRTPLHSKIRSSNPKKGIVIEEFQFESEPGIRIPGWFITPSANIRRPTVLYLTEDGGDDVVAEPGSMDRLLAAGYAICAISLRGLGITLPRFPQSGPVYYGEDFGLDRKFSWTCLVMGKSVIGQRVWDTLRAVDYLVGRPDVDPSQIRILGVGGAGLAAMMAAFLDNRLSSILVNRTLVSYLSILESENYSLKLSWFVPGILRQFDLPKIAVGLSPRPCWILNGVDPTGQVLSETAVREQSRGIDNETPVPASLRFLVESDSDPQKTYLEWLKCS